MRHWHYRMPGLKAISHSHDGGNRRHEHAKLRGYGLTRKSLRIEKVPYSQLDRKSQKKLRNKYGLRADRMVSDITGYAIVSRVVGII